MLHAPSTWGLDGKEQELKSYVDHSVDQSKRMFGHYLKRILSDKEIEEMFNGKEFRFNEIDAIKRLKKYSKGKLIELK